MPYIERWGINLAAKKTTGSQSRSKKSTGSRSGGTKTGSQSRAKAGSKKASAKSAKGLTKAQEQKLAEQKRQRNQIRAVLLFACAILLGCMVVIPGESVWNWLHNFLLGMFGTWAILWPILLIYVAVMTSMEKPTGHLRTKILLSVAVIILACSASYIFSDIQLVEDPGYFPVLGQLYLSGMESGGSGLSGGLLGYPFVSIFGGIGSKIAILLVLFVAIMILTGTTLIQLFRTMAKPAKAVADNVGQARERRQEKRQTRRMVDIDIDIDDPPQRKTKSRAEETRRQQEEPVQQPNEKRERLLQAFAQEEPEVDGEPELSSETGPVAPTKGATPAPEASGKPAAPEKSQQPESKPTPSQPETAPKGQSGPEPALRQEESGYVFPPVSMLEPSRQVNAALELEEQQHNGQLLVQTLKNFGVQTKILDICRGPAVTRYELQPAAGVKISKITNLSDDIAMNLAASGVRIEAPIPGKAAVGIEVPNKHKSVVRMRDLVESNAFLASKSRLTVALGRDIAGQPACADLAKMPHILIAGTTGSGKSVCINSLIISLLYKSTPEEVRLLMIDPKVVELGIYNGIPHLLVPVVTDPRKAAGALGWAVTEMLGRYKTFADCSVRDLAGYNKLAESRNFQTEDGQPMPKMPQIVIIIDELSDLMMAAPNEVEDSICRLAQMARAAGMHLVVATQRPSVDVVTGLIKANIPSRIAFAVSSAVDSRTILDTGGAEKLLGQGDMLFAPVGCQKPVRIQGCFVSDGEIESIVNFVKNTRAETEYDGRIMEEIEKNAVQERGHEEGGGEAEQDPMLNEAIKCVVEAGQASTSLLQRRLRLGYARAGRLIDELEQLGVVGPHEGSKPRQVLMTYQQWLERCAQQPD